MVQGPGFSVVGRNPHLQLVRLTAKGGVGMIETKNRKGYSPQVHNGEDEIE